MKVKNFFCLILVVVFSISIMACESMTTVVQTCKELQKNGYYAESISKLEEARKKGTNMREVNYLLAVAFLNTGRFEEAQNIFKAVVETQDDQEKKSWLKKEIAKELRSAFFRYLAKNDSNERRLAEKIYCDIPLYNTDSDFMNGIKKDLEKNGVNFLNKYTHGIASDHFTYLHNLDKSFDKIIAEAYFSEFKKGGDDEYLAMLLDRAIYYNRNQVDIQKTFSEYYLGLSKKAETTERAVAFLEIANKFGNLYFSELQAKKEQLENEKFLSLIKNFESKYGPAKLIELTIPDKWVSACSISSGSKIVYLSRKQFKQRDNVNKESVWKESPKEEYWYIIDGAKTLNVEFCYYKNSTSVYFWPQN